MKFKIIDQAKGSKFVKDYMGEDEEYEDIDFVKKFRRITE